jgi:hypothetical protein
METGIKRKRETANIILPKENCIVCYEELDNIDPLICGHIIHPDCIKQQFKPECPLCRTPLNVVVIGTKPKIDDLVYYESEAYDSENDEQILTGRIGNTVYRRFANEIVYEEVSSESEEDDEESEEESNITTTGIFNTLLARTEVLYNTFVYPIGMDDHPIDIYQSDPSNIPDLGAQQYIYNISARSSDLISSNTNEICKEDDDNIKN